jgi:hypothetical protein
MSSVEVKVFESVEKISAVASVEEELSPPAMSTDPEADPVEAADTVSD